MKIKILDNSKPELIMRRSGYGFLRDRQSGQDSYVRRLGSGFYPRFHAYLSENYINLHLDQKQASYDGVSAHSGEYDSEVVEREGERIKKIMADLAVADNEPIKEEKASFWKRIF